MTEQKFNLVSQIQTSPPPGWEKEFQDALPEIKNVESALNKETRTIFPYQQNTFRVFYELPFDQVEVVLFGMDPYPNRHAVTGAPKAQGMAFSVASDDQMPASMRMIVKELMNNFPGFTPKGPGNLISWVKQGVLLLNAELTVAEGEPDSHKGWWSGFIIRILRALAAKRPGIIYVLWGARAQDSKLTKHIDSRGIQLTAAHPAAREGQFLGNGHFKKINMILMEKKKKPIYWEVL